ncbi:carboxyl transferase domain-containing protein [Actinomadura viridis]|uniref:Acetyl-coenzyme A carboxylase carboxyl transferase subunits beta/alpha n=1 Tax=Actinomadura viridis TaxID=58110 RepID=A0A931DPS8_9ACTN|nr:carboxyl transferase domain-containing protein [Actinomadura viridis]MBG6091561.1 acetyl-CoA carboxylase carboxyl transferase subunit beta [Actinomadura viridis]
MPGPPGGRIGARELLRRVLDGDGHESWDTEPYRVAGPGTGYARELAAARERTGCDEAVLTGAGRLRGRRIGYVVSEFGFLAGSIGLATAGRIVAAIDRATAEGLPLLAAPSSGGTRMQEGTAAFTQMAAITAAVSRHRAAGLPYLVHLRHPTTGGVFASWGSLGHVTFAEPGALIGFLGPRVYEGLYGEPFPEGVQVAENLLAKGLVDAVVGVDGLGAVAAAALDVLCARTPARGLPATSGPRPEPVAAAPEAVAPVPVGRGTDGDAWESIRRSRRPARPGVRDLLRYGADGVTPMSGAGQGEADSLPRGRSSGDGGDPGMLLVLARVGGVACVVVGQDRAAQRDGHLLGPEGLRVARRGVRLAAELGLPLVTVVDTPGAVLSAEAEEAGLAGEIARCLADLITLPAPTLCLLLGEGAGGAALALLPADRVLAARHAWLSPLPPEGASVIVHRTPGRAAEMAAAQGVRSADLLRDGIVDALVDERPDAADEPEAFCRRAAEAVAGALTELVRLPAGERLARRDRRYRPPSR